MQQLQYATASSRIARTSPQRSIAIALVVALHAVVLYALVKGLDVPFLPKVPPITQWTFIHQTQPALPPPPEPVIDVPVVEVAPPIVDVQIQPGQGNPITAMPGNSDAGPWAIAGTHTIPEYPPLSRSLGEEGRVWLRIAISGEGIVSDVRVERSSGFPRLDATAVSWVKAHWRYRPAMRDGKPIPSETTAAVTFRLTDS